MTTRIALQAIINESLSGHRLDQAAARLFPDYSRARLQDWIADGSLRVNGRTLRSRDKVWTDDSLELDAELESTDQWAPEPMDLQIVYEDAQLLVIDKPAGAVVHPAAGHYEGTLLNGLLHYCPDLELLPRGGIVHRLDKDTTGLMVVAKTLPAHTSLVRQLQARSVSRIYEAVVSGVLTGGGTVDLPLGRHPVQRKKQAVVAQGKQAITHYTVLQRFTAHTHIQVQLETGRTHQIRVHMAHRQYPLVGDRLYGGRLRIPAHCSQALVEGLRGFPRQALHARRLSLVHPASDEELSWESELPGDMQALLGLLQSESQEPGL